MTLNSRFDEGDIIHCLDLMAQQERWFKCVGIESWGSFNGFRYQVVEVDKKGKRLYDNLIETYDDEDFKTQFLVYKVKKPITKEKNSIKAKEIFSGDVLDIIDNLFSITKPKGDDKK